ncbi:SCO family protein [Lacibacter sediminis]|uniref:SCO family protein n=1 Tax=Lacibacter sediminis TaxID=2760713 RepID=A0A7G5XKG0_9BACT|nr:SCO family protein [Lacibacter sediminis]QNA45963.1 SCO family protein [Lacibacter sediminis]
MYQTVFLKISLYVLIVCSLACSPKQPKEQLPYYNSPDFTPVFLAAGEDVTKTIPHTIDSFSFTNQLGNNITEQTVDEKIHVANFIFTRCASICPVMTKHMKMVEKEYATDNNLVILSYSVTPWIDSVNRLKEFAEQNKITSSNWHLLTGNKAEIYNLARRSYFAEEDLGFTKDSSEFLHTEHVLLIDKTKRIRGIYNGTLQLEIEQLIKDIKVLRDE